MGEKTFIGDYRCIIFFLNIKRISVSGRRGNAFACHGIPKVACSLSSGYSRSCDIQPAISGARGFLPNVGWGVMASQLDLPSLTPLSVDGYCRRN